jgi:hypothetical protein
MIVSPDNWPVLWETIEQEMQDSPERNIAVIFSVHEVETVCAVKMLQVRGSVAAWCVQCAAASCQCAVEEPAWPALAHEC